MDYTKRPSSSGQRIVTPPSARRLRRPLVGIVIAAVLLQFASPITFTGDTSVAYTPLALTSTQSGTEPAPVFFSIDREWTAADFPASNLTVAALVEGPLAGPAAARMVVVADGNFAVLCIREQRESCSQDYQYCQ